MLYVHAVLPVFNNDLQYEKGHNFFDIQYVQRIYKAKLQNYKENNEDRVCSKLALVSLVLPFDTP